MKALNHAFIMLTCALVSGPHLLAVEDEAIAELKEEVAQMRTHYEQRIEALESKLEALEAERAKAAEESKKLEEYIEEARAVARESASEAERMRTFEEKASIVHSQILETQRQSEESMEEFRENPFLLPGRKQLWKGFTFNGYLRAGAGFNEKGGGQEEFVIPDGLFEIGWRLGNEKDIYGELLFSQELIDDPDAIQAEVHVRTSFKLNDKKLNYLPVGTSNSSDPQFAIREAYVNMSNILENEEISFWAGERFYDRHDIHINDFYFLDMSGFGGGVENIPLGPGKLAIAYLSGTYDNLKSADSGRSNDNNLDFRWKELEFWDSTNMFWLNGAFVNGGDDVAPDDEYGMGIGWISERTINGSWNKTSIQYGFGAGADFNTYIADWKPKGAIGDQQTVQFTHQTIWDVSDDFSVAMAAVYQYEDLGFRPLDGLGQDTRHYLSAGIRPIWYIDGPLALQLEAGVDWTDENRFTAEKDDGGYLAKFTIAPTIKPRGGFWTRPEIRLFMTYAVWSDEFEGQVGGPAYTDDNSGVSFGIQAEVWW